MRKRRAARKALHLLQGLAVEQTLLVLLLRHRQGRAARKRARCSKTGVGWLLFGGLCFTLFCALLPPLPYPPFLVPSPAVRSLSTRPFFLFLIIAPSNPSVCLFALTSRSQSILPAGSTFVLATAPTAPTSRSICGRISRLPPLPRSTCCRFA